MIVSISIIRLAEKMSSVGNTSEITRAFHDVTDDHNVLSLQYKYGMTTSQRIKDIFKEILNGT